MPTDTAILPELVKCEWQGPFSFRSLLTSADYKKEFGTPGVYLWIDPVAERKLCYVGRAMGNPDLWTRQWQHYTFLLGCQYHLPACAETNAGEWGMDYVHPLTVETVFDFTKYCAVVKRAFDYAARVKIWLCPLKSALAAKSAERQLIYHFQPDEKMRGVKNPPSSLCQIEHWSARWATDDIQRQFKKEMEFKRMS